MKIDKKFKPFFLLLPIAVLIFLLLIRWVKNRATGGELVCYSTQLDKTSAGSKYDRGTMRLTDSLFLAGPIIVLDSSYCGEGLLDKAPICRLSQIEVPFSVFKDSWSDTLFVIKDSDTIRCLIAYDCNKVKH